jgi:hypothetical protein
MLFVLLLPSSATQRDFSASDMRQLLVRLKLAGGEADDELTDF